jgi:hypothetical protein
MPKRNSNRKGLSKKQSDALARGRAIRRQNIKNQTGGDQDGMTKVVSAKKAARKWKNKSLSSPTGRGLGAPQAREARRTLSHLWEGGVTNKPRGKDADGYPLKTAVQVGLAEEAEERSRAWAAGLRELRYGNSEWATSVREGRGGEGFSPPDPSQRVSPGNLRTNSSITEEHQKALEDEAARHSPHPLFTVKGWWEQSDEGKKAAVVAANKAALLAAETRKARKVRFTGTQQLRAAGSAVSQFAKDRYELKWSKAALAGAQDKLELVEAMRGPIARYLADLGTLGAMAATTGGLLALGPMVLESAVLLAIGMWGLATPFIIAEAVGSSVGSMVVAAVPNLVKFQAHYTIAAERRARDRMVREITENLTAIDRRNADPETVAVPVAEHYNIPGIPYDGTPAAVAALAVPPAAHRRLLRRNSSSSSDEGD